MNAIDPPRTTHGGLLVSLRALASTVAAMAHTRVALLGTELEEELNRIVGMLIGAMVCLALAGLAVLFGALLVVSAFWDTHRTAAVAWVAAAFFALAVASSLAVLARGRRRSRLLAATLGELERDRSALSGDAP